MTKFWLIERSDKFKIQPWGKNTAELHFMLDSDPDILQTVKQQIKPDHYFAEKRSTDSGIQILRSGIVRRAAEKKDDVSWSVSARSVHLMKSELSEKPDLTGMLEGPFDYDPDIRDPEWIANLFPR